MSILDGGSTILGGVGSVASDAGTGLFDTISQIINRRDDPNAINEALDYDKVDCVFPHDLELYNYYMSFTFERFYRRSIFDRKFFHHKGSIRLPLPVNLLDSLGVHYSQEGLPYILGALNENVLHAHNNGALASAAHIAAGATASLASGAQGVLQRIMGARQQNSGIDNLNDKVIPQALAISGLAVNPFMAVMFKTPRFKRHSFTWRLSPNTPEESEILLRLIQKFRYHMLPDIARAGSSNFQFGGALLTYPDTILINIHPTPKYTYRFKRAVVEEMAIAFAPNRVPSFFTDKPGAPTDVELTMTILEIEYWLKPDIYDPSGFPDSPNAVVVNSPNSTPTPSNPTDPRQSLNQ